MFRLRSLQDMDVICILAGGMIQENGKWRSTYYNEKGDNFGVLGDFVRVIAGSVLFKHNKNICIITSGGKGQFKNIPDAPNLSTMLKDELISLGVSEKSILEEDKAGNTYSQLVELSEIITKRNWKKVGVISNEWHLPRIQTMVEYNEILKKLFSEKNIIFISAEKIVIAYDESRDWKHIIQKAYESKELQNRINLENKGVQDIKEGKYRYK